jgi:hypothetical protein
MTRAGFGKALLLAVVASAPQQGRAQALGPPVRVSVLSTRSATGTFSFSISGASATDCAALAQDVRLDRAPSALAITEFGACTFVATPAAPLAAGGYCLTLAQFTGTFGERCFEVTNAQGDLAKAQVALQTNGPDIWSAASCLPCVDPADGNACTQSARGRNLIATLEQAAPELASEYAFAVTFGVEGEPVSEPGSSDFGLLDGALAQVLLAPQRDDAGPCATVFARRFGSTMNINVGRACVPPVTPSVVPDTGLSDPALCEPGYWARWCRDNRDVCASEPARAIATCEEYETRCSEAGLDAGASPEPAVDAATRRDATTDDEADDHGDSLEAATAGSPGSKKKGGCQIGPADGFGVSWAWSWLICGALVLRRRQRR